MEGIKEKVAFVQTTPPLNEGGLSRPARSGLSSIIMNFETRELIIPKEMI